MFPITVDPYDVPPAWWEAECVRYGLSYTPVRSRLMALMGSHIVRLTDYKYMTRLASKLQENYEAQQKIRIKRRELLKPVSIVPELHMLPESLLRKMTRHRRYQCTPKFHAVVAKKCKQLPQLLLIDDPQLHKNS